MTTETTFSSGTHALFTALAAIHKNPTKIAMSGHIEALKKQYSTLSDILDWLHPRLAEQQLLIVDVPQILDASRFGSTMEVHHIPSGQWMKIYAEMKLQGEHPWDYLTIHTYLRRMCRVSGFNLSFTGDANEGQMVTASQSSQVQASSSQEAPQPVAAAPAAPAALVAYVIPNGPEVMVSELCLRQIERMKEMPLPGLQSALQDAPSLFEGDELQAFQSAIEHHMKQFPDETSPPKVGASPAKDATSGPVALPLVMN